MNKTAAFTSLTMLLSVAQYGFAAESLARMQELLQPGPAEVDCLEEQAQAARELYESTPTRGRTLYQLERLILPSYKGFKIKSMGISELSLRTLALGGVIGGGMAITGGGAAAGIATPATALVVGEWMHKCGRISRHNGYKKRAHSTPELSILGPISRENHPSILEIKQQFMDSKKTYFNMQTFEEYPKLPDGYGPASSLSLGGYKERNGADEGLSFVGNPWEPQIKIHGQVRVTMDPPQPPHLPEIKIWKCNGACDPGESSCNAVSCQDLLQICESPSEEVLLRSFALSLCGQYIALGCENGAVMILHRNDDIAAGKGWKYCDAFEKRVDKPITTYLTDHIRDLKAVKILSPQEREKLQQALGIESPPTV